MRRLAYIRIYQCRLLVLRRLASEILLDHKRYLEGDSVLEFTKVKSCDLADLFKSVYESISMYEKLSGGFGNVKIVIEEALNCHQSLTVERFEASLLENLLKEHFAKSGGKLVDKSADSEVLVADDVLLSLKYLTYVESYLSLLVCSCKVLEVVYDSRDTDVDLGIELGCESIGDVGCNSLDLLDVG